MKYLKYIFMALTVAFVVTSQSMVTVLNWKFFTLL